MLRFMREMINPSLKCERLEHDWGEWERAGLVYPSKSKPIRGYYVVDSVKQQRVACRRCHAPHPEKAEWETIYSEGQHGISLPIEDDMKLKQEGFLELTKPKSVRSTRAYFYCSYDY